MSMSMSMSTRGRGGRAAASSSPTNTKHSAFPHSHPRPKSLRSGPPSPAISPVLPSSTSTNTNTDLTSRQRTHARGKGGEQRRYAEAHLRVEGDGAGAGGSESDLTPEPSEGEDVELSVSGRAGKKEKGKEKSHHTPTHGHGHGQGAEGPGDKGKKEKRQSLTAVGRDGRARKRDIKLAEGARRRARDAKFDPDSREYKGLASAQTLSGTEDDDASSFGDDESGMDDDEEGPSHGLPLDLVGQDIEDLGYGNGKTHMELKREMRDAPPDAENEDEDMAISDLSGSEAGHQSVTEEDASMSEDESLTSDEDAVDEYGLPIPGSGFSAPEGPLILMENWNGEFVLIQPKKERSRDRTKRRNSLGSKTNASLDDRSTVMSAAGDALIVDPDAASDMGPNANDDDDMDDDEGDEGDSVSSWSDASGMSDCGDTTDSMEEEDMPLLDSPALDQLITDPLASIGMGLAVNGVSGAGAGTAVLGTPIDGLNIAGLMATPSIVVTDMSAREYLNPAEMEQSTAVLGSTALDNTTGGAISTPTAMSMSIGAPSAIAGPSSPSPSSAVGPSMMGTSSAMAVEAPSMPKMGTFHPAVSHPAQHAIIDGSKTATKSPFTHRRRSRGAQSFISASDAPLPFASSGKRKNSMSGTVTGTPGPGHASGSPFEPFSPSPSAHAYSGLQTRSGSARKANANGPAKAGTPHTLPKKARYSSIPGHPRYIAARQRALEDAECERESTPSPSDDEYEALGLGRDEPGLSLEDMVETSFFHSHPAGGVMDLEGAAGAGVDGLGSDVGFRFDRVPMGSYLRRNLNGETGSPGHTRGRRDHAHHGHGHGHGAHPNGHYEYGPLGATLLGRAGVSPILAPEVMMEGKKKRGRRMPALQI